jgi:hypothetical protein
MGVASFLRLPGIRNGRIAPAGYAPAAGTYAFCLGSDVDGEEWQYAIGDGVMVSQDADVTGLSLVRFAARIRGPSTEPPSGRAWVFSWSVGGVVQGSRTLEVGRTVSISDGAFDVSQLAGVQTFSFSLEVALCLPRT